MSIFKFLKRSLSKGKTQKTSDAELNNVTPGNQALIASLSEKAEEQDKTKVPASETEKSIAAAQSSVNAGSSLDEMYRELKNRKGGFLNMSTKGKLYTSAISALGKVNQTVTKRFTADPTENFRLLNELDGYYHELIRACSEYTSYVHPSPEGQIRNVLMEQVLDRAGRDSTALSAIRTDFCSLPPEEQQSKSIPELLRQARAVRISVQSLRGIMANKEGGGQASEVVKLNGDNASVMGLDGTSSALDGTFFFKPEDEMDMRYRSTPAKIMENVMSRYPDLTDNDKHIIRKWAVSLDEVNKGIYISDAVVNSLSAVGKLAVNNILSNVDGAKTTIEEFSGLMGFRNDEKVNMTRRNVATSRVAALLGIGNLVAESKTAEIYDESNGTVTRGNIMKKSVYSESARSAADDNKARTGQETVSVTGGFQRDLINLQVLDAICGQHDRHQDNYFVSRDEFGNFSGLQGIDNDASFGRGELSLTNRIGGSTRTVYNDNNEMTIPYMDKNLAERIRRINPEIFKYALHDLLKPDEIEAAENRLKRVKEAVEKQMQTDPSRFLEDDQWNDDTAQAMLNDHCEKSRICNEDMTQFKKFVNKEWLQRNYYGDLMMQYENRLRVGLGETPSVPKMKKERIG